MAKQLKKSDVLTFEDVRIIEGNIYSQCPFIGEKYWNAELVLPLETMTSEPKLCAIRLYKVPNFDELKRQILTSYQSLLEE